MPSGFPSESAFGFAGAPNSEQGRPPSSVQVLAQNVLRGEFALATARSISATRRL